MKPSIPSRLLIRSGDGTWIQTTCRDIQEVQRIWSARKDAAIDVGILCSSLNKIAPRAFDSVAKRNAGRMLLSEGMKSRLPPPFETSADPVATVDGIRLFVGLRGLGNSIADTDMEESVSKTTDDPEIPMERQQDWVAAFVRENPDTADNLSRFGIRHEDSYLAGESELPADLRRRLGVFRAYRLAGADSSDPCALAKAAPPWLREREVTTLSLSVRSANVFKVESILTVNDLADWSMAELLKAPNFGRTSLANILQRLVAALEEGPTASAKPSEQPGDWLAEFLRENPDTVAELSGHGIQDESSCRAKESELPADLRRRLGVFLAHRLIGDRCEDPCELARAAPAWLRDRKFVSMMLPVRVETLFRKYNILTVNDLSSWRSEKLLEQYNFGRTSLRAVFRAIDDALEEGAPPTGADGETGEADAFLEQFRRSLEKLSERERDILTRRLGFERETQTLQQIGDDLGFSGERIRQIESKAVNKTRRHNNWCETLEGKMAAMMKERKHPLAISGMEKEDLWFKGMSSHGRFCENLISTIFKDSVHVIKIDGVRYCCSLAQQEWDAMVSWIVGKLRPLSEERWNESGIRNFVVKQLPPEAQEFADLLWRKLSPKCQFAALPGGVRVFTGYGHLARHLVQAILSESDKPLHFTKILEIAKSMETGKGGGGPDAKTIRSTASNVGLLFGRGTYGLRKHLRLSDEQMADIRNAAESVISSRPEKQWHSFEMLPEVRKRLSRDPTNLDEYTLDIVLAGSKRLAGLGRMIWTAAGEEQNRKNIHSEVVAIIEEAGRPLNRREVLEQLRSGRGINKFFHIPAAAPLVRLENRLWGINDRDVPVKRERQLELIEILVGQLEAKRCGIHESELHQFLELDGCPARTFASIAAQDSRLKKDNDRYLYLSEWGKPGRRSVRSALLQIMNDAGEPPTFRETVERVEALVGRKCDKQSISNALYALNAQSRK